MSENESYPLTSKSPLGRAMMLQALSAIMIIGSLVLSVPTLDVELVGVSVMAGFLVIGFTQILLTRAVLQKEKWGISSTNTLSILAVLFALAVGFFWIIQYAEILLGIYFIVIGMVNTILVVLLFEIRKTM